VGLAPSTGIATPPGAEKLRVELSGVVIAGGFAGTITSSFSPSSFLAAGGDTGLSSTTQATAFGLFGHPIDDLPVLVAASDEEASSVSDWIDTLGNPAFDEPVVCVNGLYIATGSLRHHSRRHWH